MVSEKLCYVRINELKSGRVIYCRKPAYNTVSICSDYIFSKNDKPIEPFSEPFIALKNLCEEHFKMWCKATYEIFYGNEKVK